MLNRLWIAIALALVLGCAAQPPEYGPRQHDRPEGYSERPLEGGLYLIRYETYRKVTPEDVEGFALRRAAELTRARGYGEFEVLHKQYGVESHPEWVQDTGTGVLALDGSPASLPGHTRAFHVQYSELLVRFLGPTRQADPQ